MNKDGKALVVFFSHAGDNYAVGNIEVGTRGAHGKEKGREVDKKFERKINSEKLWDYIFDLPSGKKVRFKVYHDDVYFTEILWNGIEFEWASGNFRQEHFLIQCMILCR